MKWKGHLLNGRIYLQTIYEMRINIQNIKKNSYNSISEIQTTQLKDGQNVKRNLSEEDIHMANRHRKRCSPSLIIQFSSVQSLSRVQLFATPWIAARQASLPITNSLSSLKLMFIESVMPSSHLILCCPLLLLPPIRPSIRDSALCMRPKIAVSV